jgi:hypothetical protein
MITGNGSLSLRKKDLENQKTPTVGFRKTVFAHKASAGQTGFNLASLTTPTELTANGFSQPSVGELQNANLLFYRNNLKLISSARGVLIDYISYTLASSTQINFLGFTALEGEIFYGVIDYSAQTGLKVVDASPIIATGTLAAGQTDFNVGTPFKIAQYPSLNIGGVLVYVDRALQQRNTSNSSTTQDKDYYEVDSGTGLGSIIRFNEADPDEDREITVVSNGLLAERPDGSMMAVIESLSGYLDNITEVVAQLAGLSEAAVKGAAPSNVDLKNFGDKVYTLEQNRARIDQTNTFTAMQLIPGRVDGSSVPTGYIGEQVIALNDGVLRSLGSTQNSYLDMPAGSFVMQPGIWMLTAQATLQIDNVTGGAAGDGLIGYVAIRTAANALVAETAVATANLNLARAFGSAPVIGFINITTPTTYKLSGVLKTISGAVSVSGSMFRGDFTPTKVTAVRIG